MSEQLYPRFRNAEFGDMFVTRDGCRALYIGIISEMTEDDTSQVHLFYVEGDGPKRYYDDGQSCDGIAADDIVGRDGHVDESRDYFIQGWVLAKVTDCLSSCSRYIKAVKRRDSRDGNRIDELTDMIARAKYLLKL